VGGRSGATLILHGDRDGIFPVENPGEELAWWVCGLGDALGVVGAKGMVLLDSGRGFEAVDSGLDGTLFGCWGTGPEDFWVVGGDQAAGPAELTHFGPDGPEAPHLGALVPRLPKVLYKMWGTADLAVVVGDLGRALVRDAAGEWSLEQVPGEEPMFTVTGRGRDEVWAVGGRSAGRALRRGPEGWEDRSPVGAPGLFGVWTAPGQPLLAAGQAGAILEHRGGEWLAAAPLTNDTLHSIWGDSEGGAWAVGGNMTGVDGSKRHGVVLVR
jgi:hypothetical protein